MIQKVNLLFPRADRPLKNGLFVRAPGGGKDTAKTTVAHISEVKYLGYGFYSYKGCRFKVHSKSVAKLKEVTNRNNAMGKEYRARKLSQIIKGWINYFKLADMKRLLMDLDEWLRHRIRAIYWKQWKKVRTRYRKLRNLGMPEWVVSKMANCQKRIWRAALMLNKALTDKEIVSQGFISMTDYYLQVCEN